LLGNIEGIIAQLEQQKAAIENAISVLSELEGGNSAVTEVPKRGRPVKAATPIKKKRTLSEEGRKRIAAAAKKRWAAIHRAARKAA
jgi:hypothetical protein